MSLMPSATAVTSSVLSIRYEPSPTMTMTSRSSPSASRPALGAEAAGDLVAHAGEGVLDVVAERIAHAPELVQVAGQRARGLHDDVLRGAGATARRR